MNQTAQTLAFQDMPLSPEITRAINDMHYTAATEIQAAAIPFLLNQQDVIGNSSTGTGKTAAFGIPAVELVEGALKHPQILVLSPTRELAMQIALEMKKYCKYKEGITVAAVYGGAQMSDQIRQLRRANIVIGTPGRIMDHLRRKTLKLDRIKMVVLDEADEMLSMGFIEDIQTILVQAPDKRQTVLFSATMPPAILKISEQFLDKPEIVNVMSEQNNQADIEQTYYYVPQAKKKDALELLLKHTDAKRSIIFCNTKSMVDELALSLGKQGLAAAGLHGDMTQAVRSQVMQSFRSGNTHILIATDVAARGIDVNDVDIVINFDLPQSFEYYVHRIGRTGRAGKQGISQTLVCNRKQLGTLNGLMRYTGTVIEERSLPSSQDMIDYAVNRTAEGLIAGMPKKPGKVAKQLVDRLLDLGAESGVTAEALLLTLAEKIIGGDEKYKTIPSVQKAQGSKKERGRDNQRGTSSSVVITANIGRNDHIRPNHIVGALTELLGVSGNDIGKIDIRMKETHIGLSRELAQTLVQLGEPVRINRHQVIFTGRTPAVKSNRVPARRSKNNYNPRSRVQAHSR